MKILSKRSKIYLLVALLLCTVSSHFTAITVLATEETESISEQETTGETETEQEENIKERPSYINAKAAILIDADSGQILFEQNADTPLPPASTTKVMTALLTIEAIEAGQISLDQQITVTNDARNITPIGGSVIALPIEEGEIVTVQDLLYAVLLKSDCVCCNILAEVVSGDVDTFVARMNERAEEIGCTNTTFLNTHGYKQNGHAMSAHDLALIAAEAMKHPAFYEIVDTAEYTIPATNINEARDLRNTNWLLGTMWDRNVASYGLNYQYPYAHGVKTGYTAEAGHCLASYVEKDGTRLVCAILGAEIETSESTGYLVNYMYSESIRLYDWALSAYTSVPITVSDETIAVTDGEQEQAAVGLAEEEYVLLSKTQDINALEQHITYTSESLAAPLEQGTEVGTLQVTLSGETLLEVPIVLLEEIKEVQNTDEEIGDTLEEETEKGNEISFGMILRVIVIAIVVFAIGFGIFAFIRNRYYFD